MRDAIGGYGLKVPQEGDKGKPVFDALENAVDRLSEHSHNGLNSSKVASIDLTREVLQVSFSDWQLETLGNAWKYIVTAPGYHSLSKSVLQFRVIDGAKQNQIIFPTIVPDASSEKVFSILVGERLNLEILFT